MTASASLAIHVKMLKACSTKIVLSTGKKELYPGAISRKKRVLLVHKKKAMQMIERIHETRTLDIFSGPKKIAFLGLGLIMKKPQC